MPGSDTSQRNTKIALVLAVIALLVVSHSLGVFDHLGSPAEVKEALVRLGGWGQLAFVLAYTLLQPFGVPGTVFIWAAPLIWPWPIAFALSMTGTMAASLVGFAFARFVARDWVAARIPAWVQKYADALERRAFTTVFVLRFVLWMPPWLHAFFGISRVPFWTHFWASLAGYAVPLLLVSFFGQQLFELMSEAPLSVWIGFGVGAALLAAFVWLYRRRSGRLRSASSTAGAAALPESNSRG